MATTMEAIRVSIDRYTKLYDGNKLQYLRSLLIGPAASAMSGLQAMLACYKDALKMFI